MIRLPNIDEEALKEIEEKLEHGRLRCATCGQLATPEKVYGRSAVQMNGVRRNSVSMMDGPGYTITIAVCASCGGHNVFMRRWMAGRGAMGVPTQDTVWFRRVDPLGRAAKVFPNTHQKHLEPYRAACSTLEVSPEASACMSRRCLQGILRIRRT